MKNTCQNNESQFSIPFTNFYLQVLWVRQDIARATEKSRLAIAGWMGFT
jgi:hypothetical protein